MVLRVLFYVAGGIVGIHGLIHLMGFVAYWPLAVISELPYRTTLLGVNVGAPGMKVYGLLWLVAALGFVAAAAGLLGHREWWRPVMLGTLVLSTAVIALDWAPSYRGAVINAVILVAVLLASRVAAYH